MIDDVLREIRHRDSAIGAPPAIEVRLRAATLRRRHRSIVRWTLAIAAAVLLSTLIGWQLASRHSPPPRPTVDSEFVAVPGSEGLPEPVQRIVIRVQMSKDLLPTYGIAAPAANGPVNVDFIVGEDGLARAVRLVL